MEIVYITTQNLIIAKDMLIKAEIKAGMSYIEMEDEIIIENNYLIKILENSCREIKLIDISNIVTMFNQRMLKPDLDIFNDKSIQFNYQPDIPKYTKVDYKKDSKRVNVMIKTKQNYIRRRYQW